MIFLMKEMGFGLKFLANEKVVSYGLWVMSMKKGGASALV